MLARGGLKLKCEVNLNASFGSLLGVLSSLRECRLGCRQEVCWGPPSHFSYVSKHVSLVPVIARSANR